VSAVEVQDAIIEVPSLGCVQFICRKFLHKKGRTTRWFLTLFRSLAIFVRI
jgi:hypothetical protein